MKILTAYVGCALTRVPGELEESFKAKLADTKATLSEHFKFKVLEFKGLTGGSERDVYLHDIHECVGKANCMVALCDYPGTGLGYELCYAVEVMKIPVLALAHEDSKVTRLVVGIESPNFVFSRYGGPAHLQVLVREWISGLKIP